ncbi:YtxH domain-containing protein [Fluviicola chungangensis]|nr:YtxH domain-containing protein [Fluviicola chungangensis]
MDSTLELAGHILKFIINKSMKMKSEEDKARKDGSSNNVSKVIGTLAAGAAVGLAAGILLAPEKGKKTRAKLLDEAKDLTGKLKKKADEVMKQKTAK